MENCLLFGNGINRCLGGMSWEELLLEIANKYYVSPDTVKSSPIAFEQLKNAALLRNLNLDSDGFAYDILKQLDLLQQDKYSEIMTEYLSLNVQNILTTNYDYCIERSIEKDFIFEKTSLNKMFYQERKRSTKRHFKIGDRRIFHIHGELGLKTSICLGNVHYADNLKAIMDRILLQSNENEYCLNEKVFSEELLSWAQFFFTDKIFIVGLGLYECDMDLWWLITYRRQLYLEGDRRINNTIIYYYLYEEKDQNFKDCLEAMGITVLERRIENNKWEETYRGIAKEIRDRLEA